MLVWHYIFKVRLFLVFSFGLEDRQCRSYSLVKHIIKGEKHMRHEHGIRLAHTTIVQWNVPHCGVLHREPQSYEAYGYDEQGRWRLFKVTARCKPEADEKMVAAGLSNERRKGEWAL
jgi:hypothetical protein